MAKSGIMVKSEVIIDQELCNGCGYCVEFCPRGCLEKTEERITAQGFTQPILVRPEQCNTCGLCARVCPRWAVEVYLSAETPGEAAIREKVAGTPALSLTPPIESCPGCMRPVVGHIIEDVLDELGVGGRAIALDDISCGGSSAFGLDFGRVLDVYDQPADIATTVKRAQPDAIVVAVQDLGTFNRLGMESFIGALNRGEKITVICCNDAIYGFRGRQAERSVTWINTSGRRQFIIGEHPIHAAEMAATFQGVAYSARGAITSPDDYEQTKSYIKNAFQKQIDNVGFSFVEILCACFSKYVFDETPIDCLKWIQEEMITDFPLGEFKNVNQLK